MKMLWARLDFTAFKNLLAGYLTNQSISQSSEVESLRTSLGSRTNFEVLDLEGQVLGLEASSSQKLPCPLARGQHSFLNR